MTRAMFFHTGLRLEEHHRIEKRLKSTHIIFHNPSASKITTCVCHKFASLGDREMSWGGAGHTCLSPPNSHLR